MAMTMNYENISELNIAPKEILNKSISVRSSREPKRRVLSTQEKKKSQRITSRKNSMLTPW